MGLKKKNFADDEVVIFDEALIQKRGEFWHFRMWLEGEGKYARLSLKTRSRHTAIDNEPPRDCRRPFGLSYAAMGASSSMA